MKNRLSELKVIVHNNDVVIFNPVTFVWYYTTTEGWELCKQYWLSKKRNLPKNQEGREFLEDIEKVLFSESANTEGSSNQYGATIHVTRNCNMKCRHCRGANETTADDLNLQIAYNFLDEAIKEGATGFAITGGEPLTKWDKTKVILEYARFRRPNAFIQLLTNGSLIDDGRARTLAKLNVMTQVSLDTLKPAVFREFRRYPIEPVLRGIRTLVDNEVRVAASIVLTKFNRQELPELIDFCTNNGIFGVHFPFLEKGGRGAQNWESLVLSDKEMIDILGMLMEMYFQDNLRSQLSLINFESMIEKIMYVPHSTACKCGRETVALFPDGRVYFCTNLVGDERYCMGKMTPGIINRMKRSPQVNSLPTIYDVEDCRNCEVNWLCLGGCKDRINLHYGGMFHPDPWCKVFKWWCKEMLFTTASLMEKGVI